MPAKKNKTIDLSENEYSATSTYMALLPELENIKNEDLSVKDKHAKACQKIIEALCAAKMESTSEYIDENGESQTAYAISQDYIINTRVALTRCRNIDQIIDRVKTSIENGKNYKPIG